LPASNRDQIAQKRIRRVGKISLQLTNRDLAKQLCLEHQRVGFAIEAGEQIRGRQFDRFDPGGDPAVSGAPGGCDEFQPPSVRQRLPCAGAVRALNSGPLHCVGRRPRPE
jgi:hypothetical protein